MSEKRRAYEKVLDAIEDLHPNDALEILEQAKADAELAVKNIREAYGR